MAWLGLTFCCAPSHIHIKKAFQTRCSCFHLFPLSPRAWPDHCHGLAFSLCFLPMPKHWALGCPSKTNAKLTFSVKPSLIIPAAKRNTGFCSVLCSLSSTPFTRFSLGLRQVQAPIAQPSSVRLDLIHPTAAQSGPLPGSASCTHSPQALWGGSLGWTTGSFCYPVGDLGLAA